MQISKVEEHPVLKNGESIVNILALCEALNDQDAMNLNIAATIDSYRRHFPGSEADSSEMVREVYAALIGSQRYGPNRQALDRAVHHVHHDIFGQNHHWFIDGYANYKTLSKPKKDADDIAEFIRGGNTIGDYGCGRAYFGVELIRRGYHVVATDVSDHLSDEAKQYQAEGKLDFRMMQSPLDLPNFSKLDGAVIQNVLHHIDPLYQDEWIRKLREMETRLIINEDIYGVSSSDLNLLVTQQPVLYDFASMPLKSQKNSLIGIDFYTNALMHGMTDMPFPFDFHTFDYWKDKFQNNGFQLVGKKFMGFEPEKVTPSNRMWMVYDPV